MKLKQPIQKGKILKRYKRFLADIQLDSGEIVVAHVPNTGSMKTCWEPNWDCIVTHHDNPKRKLKYTLEMTHNKTSWIGVNTSSTNRIAKEALESGIIKELSDFEHLQAEVKYGDSRLDFCLTKNEQKIFVEVKNVTLVEDGKYLFPDSVTTRGQKHLRELTAISKTQGQSAAMLFIIQREDGTDFSPAKEVDPVYAELLKKAQDSGVLILAYQCQMQDNEIKVKKKIQVKL